MRKALIALAILAAVSAAGFAAFTVHAESGYFSPQFTPDGAAVVVVRREVRALVFGLGYEMFTPPARVWVQHDRFSILRIAIADGRTDVLQTFPASPLQGRWSSAYRPSLTGSATAHLRWADPTHLEYELAVTRHDEPASVTYIARRRWSADTRRLTETPSWQQGYAGMAGDEPTQLHGTQEVVAIRAGTSMPCAVLLVTSDRRLADALIDTQPCRDAHRNGYEVAFLSDDLRRPAIERTALIEQTHDALVREGLARGLSDGDARLAAIRGMERRGLYPRPTVLVAQPADRATAGLPVFTITDQEFEVGLFNDIRDALDRPGEQVEKSISAYIIHRDYDTSRQINACLAGGLDAAFYVKARRRLWRIQVDRP